MANESHATVRRAGALVATLCLWFGSAGALAAQSGASPVAACEVGGDRPWTYQELLCLFFAGTQQGAFDAARARLRELGAGTLEQPWATLVLAHTENSRDETGGLRAYELAAEGFARSGEAEGEVIARQNLRNLYRLRGRVADARAQVDRAMAAAEASKAPLTIARASVVQSQELMQSGGDIEAAHRALLRAERLAFPQGPIGLRRSILFALARARVSLGRFDEAIDALERHRALRREDGAMTDAAAVAFNLLNARLVRGEARPSESIRQRLVAEAEAVLREATTLNQMGVAARAHQVLGDLHRTKNPVRADAHFRQCLLLEAPLDNPDARASCLWALSLHESARNPARAEQLSRDALTLLVATSSGRLLPQAWQARLRLVWQTRDADQAVLVSFEALDAIERFRSAQAGESGRAEVFSTWARDYYWLVGRLLDSGTPRVAQAFEVGERMRARVLLETLARAGVERRTNPDQSEPSVSVNQRIADVQRRLLSSTLRESTRRGLLDELALLELEREDAKRAPNAEIPTSAPSAPTFASLEDVQRALGAGEAMLWYSTAPWTDLYGDFGGGSWVLAISKGRVTVHRLPSSVELEGRVAGLTGLLRQRGTSAEAWMPAASRLSADILTPALATLPRDVTRLVIVSDGALHRVPFEALPLDSGQALGDQRHVSVVPSATLWVRLRQARPSKSTGRALVLADPVVSQTSPDERGVLEPLPWARREAAGIAATLDLDPGQVWEGSAASEHELKRGARQPFSVLHLAAHARADAAFPERSAVFLSPGDASEDGWLQPREIAALDLGGRLVVLSACESAEGALRSGEGPLSLARAFFSAGATAVVATRWPLRDDDAAFVMERFYRALGEGVAVDEALGRARGEAKAAGLPAAAWAGIALLGDGALRPFDPIAPRAGSWPTVVGVAVFVGVLIAIGRAMRAHRARRHPAVVTGSAE